MRRTTKHAVLEKSYVGRAWSESARSNALLSRQCHFDEHPWQLVACWLASF